MQRSSRGTRRSRFLHRRRTQRNTGRCAGRERHYARQLDPHIPNPLDARKRYRASSMGVVHVRKHTAVDAGSRQPSRESAKWIDVILLWFYTATRTDCRAPNVDKLCAVVQAMRSICRHIRRARRSYWCWKYRAYWPNWPLLHGTHWSGNRRSVGRRELDQVFNCKPNRPTPANASTTAATAVTPKRRFFPYHNERRCPR